MSLFFFAIFNPIPSYFLLIVSNSFVFQCVFDVMVFVAIIFVECHHLFAYPGKMLIKSSQIGHNWVARYLRSIKLQFHVLTLLLHWIEMNTKWTEKWTKTEHREKKESRPRFQLFATKSIPNCLTLAVQIMLPVTKKKGYFFVHLESTCNSQFVLHSMSLQLFYFILISFISVIRVPLCCSCSQHIHEV